MENILDSVSSWAANNQLVIVHIAVTVLVAIIVTRFGEMIIGKAVTKAVQPAKHKSKAEERKREQTITHIISGALKILVWPLTIISILGQVGIEIAPLLAGVGIMGVALGFGAQSLVKDVIAGLFIIMENQYGVGDVVNLDGTSGMVEDITLRKTALRDLDGVVHHIPNGTITRASNLSSEFSGINLDVGISYDSNLERVIDVVNEVGKGMARDLAWADKIIEPPAFLRVDDFGPSSIVIKITGKVEPLSQWDVTGELRKQLKLAFDKAKIEIPLPQTVIHQSKDKK